MMISNQDIHTTSLSFHLLRSKFPHQTIKKIAFDTVLGDKSKKILNPSYTIPKRLLSSKRNSMTSSLWSSSSSEEETATLKRSTTMQSLDWFQQTQSMPPVQVPVLTRSSAIKRSKVVQELLCTERNYRSDMDLVKEIYYDTAHTVLTKHEIKQVFVNLTDVLNFEDVFLKGLEVACSKDDYVQEHLTLGKAFQNMMVRMGVVYGEYCKKHQDGICKLQELTKRPQVQTYLLECQKKIKGRTTCWDLPSLLIKPVQRILKYPLLLKEIVALTPEFHQDYEQLVTVMHDIQRVADHINEIKKRKDLVEQLIHQDCKSIVNKKLTRRVHRKKMQHQQGAPEIQFQDLYRQFESKQESALEFLKLVDTFVQKTKANHQSLSDTVDSLVQVYGESDGFGLKTKSSFKKLSTQLASYPLETLIEETIYTRVTDYLKLFRGPMLVIEKRNNKYMDFKQCQYLVTVENKIPDKQLLASTEAYVSLNAYLLDELPVFMSLANKYFQVILAEFAHIQAGYWKHVMQEWKSLTLDTHTKSWIEIQEEYQQHINKIEWRMNEIHVSTL